jgi:hypothetical protein
MAGYDGFAALGDAIAGGPRRRAEDAYPARLKQNFDAFDALNQARISRAQANARERMTPDMVARALAGDPAAVGELGATTMSMASGQPNLSTFTGGLKDLGDIELQRQQVAAADAGDTARLNRLTAVAGDKLIEQTKISDGIAFDPLGTPDQALVVTPLGEATIAQKGALGDAATTRAGAASTQAQARASLYNTQAAAGGWKPGSGKAPPTAAEQEAKLAFLMAEAGRHAEKRGNDWADAWLRNEMAKAGFEVEPAQDVATPSGVRVPATRAWSQAEVQQAITDARRAISTGRITKEEARKRLHDAGLTNAAGRL